MRVLIIEDDQLLSNVIARELRDQNISAQIANDGEEGLYQATNWLFDVVLLDVMLPKLDGWEVLTRLRKKSSTPVIMLTAKDGLQDRVNGLKEGADDYLCKPFSMAELIARIQALHRRSTDAKVDHIQLDDIQILTNTHSISRDGENIEVTMREFELLKLLASQRGSIVNKQTIADYLDPHAAITYASLDVHVCNLRKKLGKDLIITVRGKGYLIE